MAHTIPAQHAIAENDDGTERPVKMEATEARSGDKDRDVFVVLLISTVLAVVALLGALAFFSGSLSGFGNMTRSPANFDQPAQNASPAQQLPTDAGTPVR